MVDRVLLVTTLTACLATITVADETGRTDKPEGELVAVTFSPAALKSFEAADQVMEWDDGWWFLDFRDSNRNQAIGLAFPVGLQPAARPNFTPDMFVQISEAREIPCALVDVDRWGILVEDAGGGTVYIIIL